MAQLEEVERHMSLPIVKQDTSCLSPMETIFAAALTCPNCH